MTFHLPSNDPDNDDASSSVSMSDRVPVKPKVMPAERSAEPLTKILSIGKSTILGRMMRRVRRENEPLLKSNLPLLIQVFAGFTQMDGVVAEEEVDSILGFLRYDYPETLYGELRRLYVKSLNEHQDLQTMASELSSLMSDEEKVLLGVQLYTLVSRAGFKGDSLVTFYLFMTNLGIASEAVDIVYQLSGESGQANSVTLDGMGTPLESISLGGLEDCDVFLDGVPSTTRIVAFRLQRLLLLKNIGNDAVFARGHRLEEGDFLPSV